MKRILLLTVVFIMMLGTSFSFAQADADNFYKSDWVKVEKVSFSNQYKMKVAGNLFLPKTMKEGEKYPAIIVGHPMGAVKEQSANLYATKMAERGFVTLSIDLSFWGEPRNAVLPEVYAEDFSAAVDFLGTRPFVDRNNIGVIGICGSGSFAISAVKIDPRLKAIATISMFNSGLVRRNGMQDSQLDTIQQRLQQASDARAQEAAGGEVLYSGDANLTDEQIAKLPFALYRQGYEYYWKTHAHPNSTFKYTTSSLLDLMSFDVTDHINLINKPLLMIAGSKADTLYMTEDAFAKTTGTKDKELFLIDGATHIETYWVPKYVDQAMQKLDVFFDKNI